MTALTLAPSPSRQQTQATLRTAKTIERLMADPDANTPSRKCFGKPSMRARKCCACHDFDLCYRQHLITRKQARLKFSPTTGGAI